MRRRKKKCNYHALRYDQHEIARDSNPSLWASAVHLVLLQGDLAPLEAQHEFAALCPDVNILCHLFDLL